MTDRECGDCRACCIVFDIDELSKPKGQACPRLCVTGCSQYAQRPQSCIDYSCAWLHGAGDDSQRPDRLGIVLDVRGSAAQRFVVATEVWAGASKEPACRAAFDAIASGGVAIIVQSPRAGQLEVIGRRDAITRLRILDATRM